MTPSTMQEPPPESTWKRYGPSRELSLSGTASFAIHALLVGLCFFGGFAFLQVGLNRLDPIALGTVVILEEGKVGGQNGDGKDEEKKEARSDHEKPLPMPPVGERLNDPRPGAVDRSKFEDLTGDESASRYIESGTLAVSALGALSKDIRRSLMDSLNPSKPPGTPTVLDVREKRVLRWFIMFDTIDGDDYRKQLVSLGIILAVPTETKDVYQVIRDLHRVPAKPTDEDIRQIRMFYAVDNNADSVKALCRSLKISPVPEVIAFFPRELEELMVEKEKNFKGKAEKDIVETRFRVRWSRSGKAQVDVEFQK